MCDWLDNYYKLSRCNHTNTCSSKINNWLALDKIIPTYTHSKHMKHNTYHKTALLGARPHKGGETDNHIETHPNI